MRGCANWRDAIADCALGLTQNDHALATHLKDCQNCVEALRESLAAATRMNSVLGRRSTVEPPSYGPDRVMARIGERNLSHTSLWRRWALVGLATVVVIVSVLCTRRPTTQPSVSALASWRSPTENLLRPPVAAAWPTIPRLGEGVFEWKQLGDRHAR